MGLSADLISQFVKVTNDTKKTKSETTTYGTIVEHDDKICVRIDGSETPTPIATTNNVKVGDIATTTNVKVGDRVTVIIKNHSATITGNLTSPSPRNADVQGAIDAATKISEFEIIIANKVDTLAFNAEVARIDELAADNVTIKQNLTVNNADINTLKADNVDIKESLTAANADIDDLKTKKLDADVAIAKYATIENLEATNADIHNLSSTYAEFTKTTTDTLTANEASIKDLEAKKLDTETAAITYANIDFSNIGQAAMEYFYANSGLIENVIVSDGTITGNLVGVTIKGDLIEANTLVADKLVIQGEDGLYYKLNTDGVTVDGEQTEYNSLNGQVILAKSITATQISVDDLVAFDATIGGFNITDNAIFSEVKDSEGNTTRGIYMDTDGQINFGDESNFIKYYKDEDGTYKLVISAASILYALNGKQYSIADLGMLGEYIHIGTYEGEPSIELGENDSDFKLIITNTRILFMEGSAVPAYINNQSLHITKAVIEEEIQQGEFVWKVRANGNMGLMWKGVSD